MLFEFAIPVVNPYQDRILVKGPRRAGAPRQHSAVRRANGIRHERGTGASRVDVKALLRWLALDPGLAATPRPVQIIVEKLAQTLKVDGVYVGEVLDTPPGMARTIAWWKDGRLADNDRYPAEESPYQGVPGISLVKEPLTSLDGRLVGQLGVVSRKRFKDERAIKQLLATCAIRVTGELERLRREHASERGVEDPSKAGPRVPGAVESVRNGETLLREVHHRVKNSLQIVASLLAMQVGAASDPFVKRALSDAINRISTIALIHAQLCEAPNLAFVDMRSFIQELVGNVRRTFSDSTTDITTSLDVDPLSLGLHLATPCGLLVSELVTNAFQHAFPHVDHGVITVRLVSDGRGITLTVLDNGRGLPPDAEGPGSRGLGLHLVQLLATRQLRGRVSIARRGGTQFTVTFPLATRDELSRSAPSHRESRAP